MIAVIDFAALLASFGVFGLGIGVLFAARAYVAERTISRIALLWQLESAQRADADYEAAKTKLESLVTKEELASWKKARSN